MTSVSDIAGEIIHPGQGVLDWYYRMGRDGKSPHADRNARARDGIQAHVILEALHGGRDPATIVASLISPTARTLAEAVIRWWLETKPRLLAIESRMSDMNGRVSGRLDYARECTCPACEHRWRCPACGAEWFVPDDGDRPLHTCDVYMVRWPHAAIGDFKYSRHADGAKNHLQVGGAYRHLWNGEHRRGQRDRPACGAELVQILDTGQPARVIPCRMQPEDWASAYQWWLSLSRVSQVPDPTVTDEREPAPF